MPNTEISTSQTQEPSPNYGRLAKFLITPLLESPDSICVDCEAISSTNKVWLRLAVDDAEKGKVFGRGRRNLDAIRTILHTAAQQANQSLYVDVYGEPGGGSQGKDHRDSGRTFSRRRKKSSFKGRSGKASESTNPERPIIKRNP